MRVSAKSDYGVRAVMELAQANGALVKSEHIAKSQGIPTSFLVKILQELRDAGIVKSYRGPDGGHLLAIPSDQLSILQIVTALDGPLGEVHGYAPDDLPYQGPAIGLKPLWSELQRSIIELLAGFTIADALGDNTGSEIDKAQAVGRYER